MTLKNLIAWLEESDRASWKHRAYLYLNGLPHILDQYYKECRVLVVVSMIVGAAVGVVATLIGQGISG